MKILFIMIMSAIAVMALDVNSASAKELTSLKGVGEVKSKAIVEFRKGRCFKSVDELALVKGIGKKTIEKNRVDLSVGVCEK